MNLFPSWAAFVGDFDTRCGPKSAASAFLVSNIDAKSLPWTHEIQNALPSDPQGIYLCT